MKPNAVWARNLLFIGLLLGGGAVLWASLFTLPAPPRAAAFDAAASREGDFPSVVARVDATFRTDWQQQKLEPAPRADELVVARRLSLALTGTIPSLQEIRQFEATPADERLDWFVAMLLQDRRHADYFAERLARAWVGTEDGPFIIYRRHRFVSWLSDELANNTSYGEIVRQLIASEGLWTDKPAVNFVSVTVQDGNPKGPNPERLAGRVTRAFLGFRLDCAECHDYPSFLEEDWKRLDFQGLAAFFGQTWRGIAGIYDKDGEHEIKDHRTGKSQVVPPAVPFLPELLPGNGTRRARLARWVTHEDNHYFARASVQRLWALMFGRPLMDAVETMKLHQEYHPAIDVLAQDFAEHNYDLRRLIRLIAATEVFRMDSAARHDITPEHPGAWAVFPMTRLRPEQVAGGILQAASVQTVNGASNVLLRIARNAGEKQFVERYGDTGEDEFDGRGGTIPQRLVLMNGQLVNDKTGGALANAVTRIAMLAPTDRAAVEVTYLAVLTRRPTAEEADHFGTALAECKDKERYRRLEDLYWALLNSTEFSWNH